MAIVVHEFFEPDFKNFENINSFPEADCEKCLFAQPTNLIDGGEGILCPVRLFDIEKHRCFVPDYEKGYKPELLGKTPEEEEASPGE